MGVSGVAPSHTQLDAWTRREAELAARGGVALPPDTASSVPIAGVGATHGLRTLPPRENGATLMSNNFRPAPNCCCQWPSMALCSPPAMPTLPRATASLRNRGGNGRHLYRAVPPAQGEAQQRNIRWPRFTREDYYIAPQWAAPQRFIATMGMPVTDDGVNDGENLTLACRNALLNMIDLLQERGFTRNQPT